MTRRDPKRAAPHRSNSEPAAEIRRFDVFAEWNRLKAREDLRLASADAKAYGLAVAKVVAGRRGRPGDPRPSDRAPRHGRDRSGHPGRQDWWRLFGSAREFDQVIVDRMGREFYRSKFRPALGKAWKRGAEYVGIRDSIRQEWNLRRGS